MTVSEHNRAAVLFNNSLAQRKPQPGPFKTGLVVKPSEELEHARSVFRRNANAVVLHTYQYIVLISMPLSSTQKATLPYGALTA